MVNIIELSNNSVVQESNIKEIRNLKPVASSFYMTFHKAFKADGVVKKGGVNTSFSSEVGVLSDYRDVKYFGCYVSNERIVSSVYLDGDQAENVINNSKNIIAIGVSVTSESTLNLSNCKSDTLQRVQLLRNVTGKISSIAANFPNLQEIKLEQDYVCGDLSSLQSDKLQYLVVKNSMMKMFGQGREMYLPSLKELNFSDTVVKNSLSTESVDSLLIALAKNEWAEKPTITFTGFGRSSKSDDAVEVLSSKSIFSFL